MMTSCKRIITVTMLATLSALAASAQTDAKDLYQSKCATCHGPDGAGQTAKGKKLKMAGVKETSAKMNADQMTKIVDAGKGPDMDAFGKQFSKAQIVALVGYYRSLAK